MPLGDNVTIDREATRVRMTLDTGTIVNGRPVYRNMYMRVKPSATDQQVYDAAYTLEQYTQYDLIGIERSNILTLGPTE